MDSNACAQRITAFPRTSFTCRVSRSTYVTPRALLVPLSMSTWLTTALVITVQLPDFTASFTVVNGLLK